MSHIISYNKHPYEKFLNYPEHLEDCQARREVGLIGGKVIFRGEVMSKRKFNSIKPVALIIENIQLDGRQF